MNPVALIIALPILKGLFEGSQAVSVSPTTPPPPVSSTPKDTGTVTLVTDVLKPTTVTDPTTGVTVPIRKISDTAKQIRDRIRYGSGL
jgi:hypothetical protein